MRLASFHAEGADRVGVEIDGRLVELSSLIGVQAPASMLGLIERQTQVAPLLKAALAAGLPEGARSYGLDEVTWRAPVPNASKICCLALNNSANADRILQGPKHPAMFTKPSSALAGHGQAIECRPEYGRVHPEPELAVVIGKTAKNVGAPDAMDYVFGYTIHNDITSPTMRGEDTFHYRAVHPKDGDHREVEYVDTWVSYPGRYKCADTFSCMGPWLVTADEVPNPHDLMVRCSHKGELVTEDNTSNLFYKVPETIAFLTGYMTLLPGDIISMGTALKKSSGGGAVQNIDLNKLGGPVSVSIERLGELINPVAILV